MTFLWTFWALTLRWFRKMTDFTKAALTTTYTTDKIVESFSGSFNMLTDSTIEVHTLGGVPTNIYVYKIAHGFTRPVFCDIQTANGAELGQGIWREGGVDTSNNPTAFSDSTYVYILLSSGGVPPSSTTIYYRILCSWIDDYDDTNPTIQPFPEDIVGKINRFDSRRNYVKIHTQSVTTFSAGTGGSTQDVTIPHTVGSATSFKVFFEALPGRVFALNFGGVANAYLFDDAQNELDAVIDSTNLYLQAYRFSNSTFRAWYRIYAE